jgi:hypothetical protein
MTTPFEEAGFNRNTKFRVVAPWGEYSVGTIVWLHEDDGSTSPKFTDGKGDYEYYCIPEEGDSEFDLEVYTERATEEKALSEGIKYDSDKPRMDLLIKNLALAVEEVVKVLTYGAKKYPDADNWKKLDELERRYCGSSMRHEIAHNKGELIDPESDCYHLSHKICGDLFRLQHMLENKDE